MNDRTQQEIITVGETRVGNAFGHPKDAQIILERDVLAEMRDGLTLATNVYRPALPGRYPVLLHLSPQGKDRIPADANYERIPNTGLVRVSEWVVFEAQDPVYWVPHGYVVIVADCRATWHSDGEYFEHFSPQMGRDFHDLVEWAARQEWCDGNVGSNGVSYLAITQWLGAAERPPHLKAIIPWEGLTDPYREWAFHGGMPDTGFYRMYMRRAQDPKMTFVRKGSTAEDMVAEQAAHPLYDDFWRQKHPDLSRIDVPAYICVSWSSHLHNRGGLEGYKQIASKEKWLEIHGRKEWEYYYTRECLERQRRFMDYCLKGKETGIKEMPRVRFEVRERFFEGRIRFADDFPVPGTEYRKL
ncbi:MAG: CocE/NonD family hydrolase, partial [Pseudomonadota bacterium]